MSRLHYAQYAQYFSVSLKISTEESRKIKECAYNVAAAKLPIDINNWMGSKGSSAVHISS